MQHDAGQIDVATAFDVELRIAVDLCLRDCTRGQNKVKVVFGRGAQGSLSKVRTKKYDRNFVLNRRKAAINSRRTARNRPLKNSLKKTNGFGNCY